MWGYNTPFSATAEKDLRFLFFFFNDTATTEIYTLSLHDALPIWLLDQPPYRGQGGRRGRRCEAHAVHEPDRKSTRLNSSHLVISYAVFCLKKKKIEREKTSLTKKKTRTTS